MEGVGVAAGGAEVVVEAAADSVEVVVVAEEDLTVAVGEVVVALTEAVEALAAEVGAVAEASEVDDGSLVIRELYTIVCKILCKTLALQGIGIDILPYFLHKLYSKFVY